MLIVRHIQTTTNAKGVVTPVLDDKGREIELWSVEIPSEIEAEGGAAIDAYVTAHLPTPQVVDAATEPVEER